MKKLRWALLGLLPLLLTGAAPTPGPGVPTPTGTLQGVFPFYWDGAAFQPQGNTFTVTPSGNGVQPMTIFPSSAPGASIAPVVSAALEATHVLKASAGNLYSIYASNLTGGSTGNLQVFNATVAPADGAVTPLICVPFSAGVAQAVYLPGPPALFGTGITAVISSAPSCFTKTTGVLTGYISGMPQ